MLSRVADSLYWMSRYLERAEHTARLLEVNISIMLDGSLTSEELRWTRMLSALGCPAGVAWKGSAADMVRQLTVDMGHRASISACIAAARENARQVRDEISSEQWQRLNRLYHQLHGYRGERETAPGTNDFLASVMDGIHLFKGVTDTTMSHGEGWQFIRLGRYLERAHATAMLLEVSSQEILASTGREPDGERYLEFVGLLRCCTAFEAYCQVYTADLVPEWILEFLLLNREFPHALAYSLEALQSALGSIQPAGGRAGAEELRMAAGKLHALLSYSTIGEILGGDPSAFLTRVRSECVRIHDLLYRVYIHYSVQTALAAS
jgi:uncharacterized alpha-E superfamily protein